MPLKWILYFWRVLVLGCSFGIVSAMLHPHQCSGSWYPMVFPQGLGSQRSNRSSGSAGGCELTLTPDFGGILLWGWASFDILVHFGILSIYQVLSIFWGHLVSSLVGTAVVGAGILCLWLWRLGAPWPCVASPCRPIM